MTPPLSLLRRAVSMLLLASACGPGPEATTARARQAIGDGAGSDLDQGTVLVLGAPVSCSGLTLAPNLILTHADCMTASHVSNGASTAKVRIAREVPGSREMVTLQLWKELELAFPRTVRDVELGREPVTCFGVDDSYRFTRGAFDVIDVNGATVALQDTSAVGTLFTIEDGDRGGFCVDQLGFVVAMLTEATNSRNTATATTMGALRVFQRDLFFSLQETAAAGAVTLVDDPGVSAPHALLMTSSVTVSRSAWVPGLRPQGFFLVEQGNAGAVLVLSASTATCLVVSGSTVRTTSCSRSEAGQVWQLSSVQATFSNGFTDGYRFRSVTTNLCLSLQGGLASCTSADTLFGLWLSGF